MDTFVEQLRIVLPILGFDLFRPRADRAASSMPADTGNLTFSFSTAGASATARETDDGFMVLAGSTARKAATGTLPAGYLALRERLIREGALAEGPTPEFYRFSTDVRFSSPSAAASIVAARSASGPLEWKLSSTGQAYRDWRAPLLGEDNETK